MPSLAGVKGKPEFFKHEASCSGKRRPWGNVEEFDVIVAGAGVVGLALGAQLAEDGHKTLVLEKEKGVRPKIVPADQTADFRISGPGDHGVAGVHNLFGIESPGLTCSLALAAWMCENVIQVA